ncbi:proline dehydrogenase family protein [Planococcus sp. ISL-109]|uniref:proline dehydrogenase family protein n=1 Tax=Planococcus sp. ISL-109 TaxID=2819166 RepID=UPI001BE902AE|nr:proline dehydrogenase family protein [Planococcus sp. ISL-109]MBT2581448.1 proline dehydrogenase family protein [Planococcus sp. ISL-109]
MGITRSFFIALSNNRLLNSGAKKWGFQLGAAKVVAGTDIPNMMASVQQLNDDGIAATIDRLGEFVTNRAEAQQATSEIIETLQTISAAGADAHLSVKLTQIGLEIDEQFCFENIRKIVEEADQHDIFVNLDMENYDRLQPTLDILHALQKEFDGVGTVIQAYLYRSEKDLEALKDVRLRLVKGAYQEHGEVALQSTEEIDANFLKLIKLRLDQPAFTSIATHDHHIIDAAIAYANEQAIPSDRFEFQMLYGFRTDLLKKLSADYQVTSYVPFGEDWYGYFMRRLAERPQNIQLVVKGAVSKSS